MIATVIVAAGQGLRMGGAKRKQFLDLGGVPIIVHTIQRFLACTTIQLIVVVLPPEEVGQTDLLRWFDRLPVGKILFVPGGADRCESVYNGLCAIEAEDGIVLIHDGVRPLVPVDLIENCIQGARRWGACIPALPAVDTVKRIDENHLVQETLPRKHIYLSQTPQAFQLSLIRNAHHKAREDQLRVTDDASIAEQSGIDVKVISGAEMNLKITTPLDLRLAETYLQIMQSDAVDETEDKNKK